MSAVARCMAQRWVAARPGGLEVFELEAYAVPPPASGEVTIEVRAAGVNPADAKHVAEGRRRPFPRGVGYEVSGVLTAIGPRTEIASGGGAVGDEVLAFRVVGGWASDLTVPARDVFAKPRALTFEQAANLLLAATTAAEMLHVTAVEPGETVLVHGASGAVGISLLQQAARRGVKVVGTCSRGRFEEVRRFGGEPVVYGPGLEGCVRDASPGGVAAALDCVGTDEALDVSLALVRERRRIVTIAAKQRGAELGIRVIGGDLPESASYRDGVRADLVRLAADGKLEVPMAGTYPLERALEAAALLSGGHPGGKLAVLPSHSVTAARATSPCPHGRLWDDMAERTLILVRHAKSDWSGDHADIDRPLAERGRRQAPGAGSWLATNIDGIDLAVVSPARRARSTWELVSAELASPPPLRIDDRVYAASGDELLAVLRELPDDLETVAVVGHNPGLEDLASRLTGGWTPMPTSALAVIAMPGSWSSAGDRPAYVRASGRPPAP